MENIEQNTVKNDETNRSEISEKNGAGGHVNNMGGASPRFSKKDSPKSPKNGKILEQKRAKKNDEKNGEKLRFFSDLNDNRYFTTEESEKSPNDGILSAIEEGKKISRVLVDLFAVTVSPEICRDGYTMKEKKTVNVVGDVFADDCEHIESVTYEPARKSKNVDTLEIDEFFAKFMEVFSDMLNISKSFEVIGGGDGYNCGRVYEIFEESRIQFRYFDYNLIDEKDAGSYASGSPFLNYVRQKINVKLTGNPLASLRSRKLFVKFLKRLFSTFDCSVTMFDMAADLFNYHEITPPMFIKLYEQGKYLSRSGFYVNGDIECPTVYLGKYKASRTIMIYNKIIESEKKGADELDILRALSEGGTWTRFEVHMSRKRNEAAQAFNFLMFKVMSKTYAGDLDLIFLERMSSFMRQTMSEKCRFLSRANNGHAERIKNHRHWDKVLSVISDTATDFAYCPKRKTLEERKQEFLLFGYGSVNLVADIEEAEGEASAYEFTEKMIHERKRQILEKRAEERMKKAMKKI